MRTLRIDTTDLIPGKLVVGNTGHGVLGSEVPSTGEHGPALAYLCLTLPDDANTEVRVQVESHTFPPGTLIVYEDTSYSVIGAPDGAYTINFRIFAAGVDRGVASLAIIKGSGASMAVTLDAVFEGSAGVLGGSLHIVTDDAVFLGSAREAGPPSATDIMNFVMPNGRTFSENLLQILAFVEAAPTKEQVAAAVWNHTQ